MEQYSTVQYSAAQHSTVQGRQQCSSCSSSSRSFIVHLTTHGSQDTCYVHEIRVCCCCHLSQAFTKVTLPLQQVCHREVPYKQKIMSCAEHKVSDTCIRYDSTVLLLSPITGLRRKRVQHVGTYCRTLSYTAKQQQQCSSHQKVNLL